LTGSIKTRLFTAPKKTRHCTTGNEKKKDDSEVVDDAEHEPPVRLYKISVKDNKITRLTANSDWIESFEISHDKKWVGRIARRKLHYTFDQKVRPIVILHSLADGEEMRILSDLRIRPEGFQWALDNSGFYVATPFRPTRGF